MKFSEMPYTRVDIKELEKSYQDLIERAKAAKSGEELFAIHQEYYKISGEANSNYTIAHIRHDIDTTDEFYSKENDYYDEILPTWQNFDVMYSRVLYESPFREYMESKIGKVVFKNIEISLKAFDEKLIPLLQEENVLNSRYSKLIATAKVPFEGEEYNISLMGKFATSEDLLKCSY